MPLATLHATPGKDVMSPWVRGELSGPLMAALRPPRSDWAAASLNATRCSNSLRTATIGAFYEHQTMDLLQEYYTWHTRLPMG